ncbi:uncharacterized protein LOC132562126 [Ylistrum balloti]|uniref:uncharacterized protein LOC132562126 n=1 Tax=Ylistrum balloti TaxID=509963 RepID=UPI002905E442|nr:uncharacterized protein LOC132562126 [Ylistrum balloti]
MTIVALLVSLLLIFIGESLGETTCRLHILDDAGAEMTTGEQLFYFLFFPYTEPEKVVYQICDTPPSNHWLFYWNIPIESLSTIIAAAATSIRFDIGLPTPAAAVFFYNLFFAAAAYFTIRKAMRYPRKTQYKAKCGHSGRRKFKYRNEDEKRDKLRFLKAQKTKSGNLPMLMHQYKIKHGSKILGKLEVNSQTHAPYKHHSVFSRLSVKYSGVKVARTILRDLLDGGALRQRKRVLQNKRENSFKEVRDETLQTLLKRKYDEDENQTLPEMSPEVGNGGGGGDSVEGTNIHFGRPCASSSFISTFGNGTVAPSEVNSDEEDIIDGNGNLFKGSSYFQRIADHGNEPEESFPGHGKSKGNSRTHQTCRSVTPNYPSYLTNTPNDSFLSSFEAGADRSMTNDDSRGESALTSSMMESFVSVSDSLQKTSTWYGRDDMEVTLFQWLSAVTVTRRLTQKAWTFLFGNSGQNSLSTFPESQAAPQTQASASPPPFPSPPHRYQSDFESDLPQYEMVD